MPYLNLTEKASPYIDKRFTEQAYSTGMCGNAFDFDGAKSVVIHSLGTAPMNDYNRHATAGTNRYGTVTDLQASAQRMTIRKDRSWTFGIEKADSIQGAVHSINEAVTRQIDEVVIPEYDRYIFNTLAATATVAGNISSLKAGGKAKQSTAAGAGNAVAYDYFLKAQEWLGDNGVPEEGRIAVCSYAMCTALKQDPGFVPPSDAGFEVKQKGFFGTVDGTKILRVPSSRLPIGCGALISHPYVSVAPKQLDEYKIHENPVGYSGWIAEGRMIYDCFVLNNKINGIYYIGMDGVSRSLHCITSPEYAGVILSTPARQATLQVQDYEPADLDGNTLKYYYRVSTKPVQPAYSSFNKDAAATSTTTEWTEFTGATKAGITPMSGYARQFVEVAQVDTSNNMVGYGVCVLNLYDEISTNSYI